jgi:hypothetical protein
MTLTKIGIVLTIFVTIPLLFIWGAIKYTIDNRDRHG